MTTSKTKPAPTNSPARAKPAAGKPPARPSRAAAQKAVADMQDKPKKSTFRGIALALPAQMPAAFSFDIAEVQYDLAEGHGLGGLHRLMVDFLGPEQWRTVRKKITADGEGIDELGAIVTELMGAIVDPYGGDAGK